MSHQLLRTTSSNEVYYPCIYQLGQTFCDLWYHYHLWYHYQNNREKKSEKVCFDNFAIWMINLNHFTFHYSIGWIYQIGWWSQQDFKFSLQRYKRNVRKFDKSFFFILLSLVLDQILAAKALVEGNYNKLHFTVVLQPNTMFQRVVLAYCQ